jgi:hypothetical protein
MLAAMLFAHMIHIRPRAICIKYRLHYVALPKLLVEHVGYPLRSAVRYRMTVETLEPFAVDAIQQIQQPR